MTGASQHLGAGVGGAAATNDRSKSLLRGESGRGQQLLMTGASQC